jgi:hypothetical protein
VKEEPVKATTSKARFEEIVGALMHVGKEEADQIMEAEKKARSKKRARKAKPKD